VASYVIYHQASGSRGTAATNVHASAVAQADADLYVYGGDVFDVGDAAAFIDYDAIYSPELPDLVAVPGDRDWRTHAPDSHGVQTVTGFESYYSANPSKTQINAAKSGAARHDRFIDTPNGWRLIFIDGGGVSAIDGAPIDAARLTTIDGWIAGAPNPRAILIFNHWAPLQHGDRDDAPNSVPLWQHCFDSSGAPLVAGWVSGHARRMGIYSPRNKSLAPVTITDGAHIFQNGTGGESHSSLVLGTVPDTFDSGTVYGFLRIELVDITHASAQFYSRGTAGTTTLATVGPAQTITLPASGGGGGGGGGGAAVILPGTLGRLALHVHTHSYRSVAVFGRLPNAAAARALAQRVDQIGGQWKTGEVAGSTNGGFLGLLEANGLLTYNGTLRAEADLRDANPQLSLVLYDNGMLSEGPTFGSGNPIGTHEFPLGMYANGGSTAASSFGNYLMDANSADAYDPTGQPWASVGSVNGWAEWISKFMKWQIDNHPSTEDYDGVYMDIMNPSTDTPLADVLKVADAARAVLNAQNVSVGLNSMVDGASYFSTNKPINSHADVVNMEQFLHNGNAAGTVYPSVTRWLNDVSAVIDAQKTNDVQLTTKIYDNATTLPQMDRWRRLILASYMVANRGHVLMNFQPFGVSSHQNTSFPNTAVRYQADWKWYRENSLDFPVYDAYFGASQSDTADAAVDASTSPTRASNYAIKNAAGTTVTGLYRRVFEHGIVFINVSGSPQAVNFSKAGVKDAYTNNSVTSPVTIGNGDALILWDGTLRPTPPSGGSINLSNTNPVLATPLTTQARSFPGTGPHDWAVLYENSTDGVSWSTCTGTGATTAISNTPTGDADAPYTPNANDVGKHLRCTMTNTPTSGSGDTQTTTPSAPVTNSGNPGDWVLPAGWVGLKSEKLVAAGGTIEGVAAYHVVGSGPEPTSAQFTAPGSRGGVGVLVALRGVDPAILAAAVPKSSAGTGTSVNPGSVVTSAADGAGLLFVGARGAASLALPSGSWTMLSDFVTNPASPGVPHRSSVGLLGKAAAGTVSAASSTLAASETYISFHLPLDVGTAPPPPVGASLTADVEPDRGDVRLKVDVIPSDDGDTLSSATSVLITRTPPSGDTVAIRGASPTDLIGLSLQTWDYEVPIGIELVYQGFLYDSAGLLVGETNTVTLTWTEEECKFWLSDPLHPSRSILVDVLYNGFPEESYDGNVTAYQVQNRWDPVTRSSIRSGADASLTVVTHTKQEADNIHLLTGQGGVLLLRSDPRFGIGNLYFVSGTTKQRRPFPDLQRPERLWIFDVLEVKSPVGEATGGVVTYDDIGNQYRTYDELAAAFPTYDDLAEGTGVEHAVEVVSRRGG
jgi:hypothetical protein